MTPRRRALLDQLLEDYLDLPPGQRDARMGEINRRYPRIHFWLERLVAASVSPTRFLDDMQDRFARYSEEVIDERAPVLPAGTRLGPWRILELAGSGGMGSVYRSERADGAFEMTVAIKLIRLKRPELEERLKIERQLLARLNHGSIARLIDGGSTNDGMAYLVMEWVEGEDLNHYYDRRKPGLPESLALFQQIADAVAHAHERLVVHGDLKPANIRITPRGRIRLLDFGVARLLAEDSDLDDQPNALTPAFSAPEQKAGEPPSTRSDVWALGALLVWQLTGRAVSVEPMAQQLAECKRRWPRQADLAAILERACSDDPEQRYATPAEMNADLVRYRQGRPVTARPRRRSYLLARFVGRHPLGVSLGAVAAVALVAAVAGLILQNRIAVEQRDRAQVESERALQVSDFVISLFEQADPGRARGVEITARELLNQGMIQADALAGQPRIQARMLTVLARVNFALGNWQTSFELAERAEQALAGAADPASPDVLQSRLVKARAQVQLRDFEDAERELRSILEEIPEPPGTAPQRLLKAETMLTLAVGMDAAGGRLDEVWPLIERGLDLTEQDPELAAVRASFMQIAGNASFHGADYDSALVHFQRAHDARIELLGGDHPDTLDSADNLSQTLAQLGRLDEAIGWQEEVLESRRRVLDPTHPMVSRSVHAIGSMYWLQRDTEQAGRWWREALALREAAEPIEPAELATTRNAVALVLIEEEQYDQAEALYRLAYDDLVAAYGYSNLRVPMVLANKAIVHNRRGNRERAVELHLEALAMRRQIVGDTHHHVAHSLRQLAGLHLDMEKPEQALDWIVQAEEVT
ncbi:MAG: serine/threonine protein kinase, partial [Wenzhouxiangella sp.]